MFPEAFIKRLRSDLGITEANALLETLQSPPPVTIRINPRKIKDAWKELALPIAAPLDISEYGFLLSQRPVFTNDPLFQSGCYYVQESSSMVLEHYFSYADIHPDKEFNVLDLCAAPGGKSTHLLSLLHGIPGAMLVSNEVIHSRVTILADNLSRWGDSNVVVTHNDPSDFGKLKHFFDVILIDAPCSGEGMFRKDAGAVAEWSEDNVTRCAARQRRIISDAIESLKPGGLLIYSTCTFNHFENEDNTKWTASEFGMEILEQEHLYPGKAYGEGLFMAALRMKGTSSKNFISEITRKSVTKPYYKAEIPFLREKFIPISKGNLLKAYPSDCLDRMFFIESKLKTIRSASSIATILTDRNGKTTLIPEPDLAFSEVLKRNIFPEVELTYNDISRFLRCETMTFHDSPKGYLLLTYLGHPVGFVKNIGSRANNLWPVSRRVRLSHIIDE
ncbi:MAG: rRNA cytosine-C5-methyltransferase [Alistipes sp.]|nr:rRNA cytosine-C5-methyltransferase [Candidatus Minthomonas equi]